ncbi:hypothetical protein HYALB_00003586, partial [Hymenoscyphus albidus]
MGLSRQIGVFLLLGSSLVSSKQLWTDTPALYEGVLRQTYPIGNGKLAAIPFGNPGSETLSLNLDSLWTGGPFESDSYTGGNPQTEVHSALPGIREWIFQNSTGNVSGLLGTGDNYGHFFPLGNLTVTLESIISTTGYVRALDLDTGIHSTNYTANDGQFYATSAFCSQPDNVCVYTLSTRNGTLPNISITLQNLLADSTVQVSSCGPNYVRVAGNLQAGPPLGMRYNTIARIISNSTLNFCESAGVGTMVIPASAAVSSVSLVIGAESNYDQTKGNAASNYTFKGADPKAAVERITFEAAFKAPNTLLEAHIADYTSLTQLFTLDLPDTKNSSLLSTPSILSRYTTSSDDPYLDSLLFDYGRHLFISSARANALPTNLLGKWSEKQDAPWSADYHANINIQMNYWFADQVGLGSLQDGLWDYIQNTWVPRGSETAKLLYDAPGWVVHDEMNIFGYTGMKEGAEWANYPVAAAWLMQHVWDHYEHSQNITWYQEQGYPLIKGVAEFWLSQLQEDVYTHDGSLVVNPCNSPEHGPTTFACTHYQQLIYQVLTYIDLTAKDPLLAFDPDEEFMSNVATALATIDKGLHINSLNEIKEWKLPMSSGYEFQNDTHRHLSHLYGWYPGYSIASFQNGYTDPTVQEAVANSLWSRGIGGEPNDNEANCGWRKVWRSACWARLNETERAYYALRYYIQENVADNGLSMYSGHDEPFQIDANFGYLGAVLSMLVVDMPINTVASCRPVILGPAIPSAWAGGKVSGLVLRGGGKVGFSWDEEGIVHSVSSFEGLKGVRIFNKNGDVLHD